MKQNYTSILTKFFLVFFTMGMSLSANALTWTSSAVTTDYSSCTGELTVSIKRDATTTCFFPLIAASDYILGYTLSYKNLSGVWVNFAKYSSTLGGLGGANQVTQALNGYNVVWSSSTMPTQIICTFKDLPNNLFGENVEIRLTEGTWAEYDCAFGHTVISITASHPPIMTQKNPTPSNLQISTTKCSEIDLTWTNPSSIEICLNPNWGAYVYRKLPGSSSWILIANGLNNTGFYTDSDPILAQYHGQDIAYKVEVVHYKGDREDIGTTESVGSTLGYPSAVSSIQASTGSCDQLVNITWNNSSSPESYKLERRQLPSLTWSTLVDSLPSSPLTYSDSTAVAEEQYHYRIRSRNSCGRFDTTGTSTTAPGSQSGVPTAVTQITSSIIPGVGVALTWSRASFTNSYKIERFQVGGGASFDMDLDSLGLTNGLGADYWLVGTDSLRTIDTTLTQCQLYQYAIKSFNDCNTLGVQGNSITSATLTPDLSNSFVDGNLNGSKGYHSDRVELTWAIDSNENFIDQFKIYRKIAGSPDDSIVLITLNSGSNIHNDFLALAGVLYEYTIIGESQCNQVTIYSNAVSAIGFRSPFGIIAGQVDYTGGIAVADVQISANSSSGAIGGSLSFNGSSSLSIPHANSMDASNGLTLEMWTRPSTHALDFVLAEKVGAFSLKHVGSNYVFSVTNTSGSQSVNVSDAVVNLNNYNQFTATLFNDTISLYLNGITAGFALMPGTGLVLSPNPLTIGNEFQGEIDEFRYFIRGKNATAVNQDFSRQMNGGEADLKVYLKMNEGIGDYAYDFSRATITNFNRNHAAFVGTPSWSSTIPTEAELSITSYTDAQGNYILTIPYSGVGETFVITPSYLVHNFTPSTRALFIGEGSAVYNNIDFTDVSSFKVQGRLIYANTSCVVPDATLKIDGNPVVSNGAIVKTDAQGNFLIQVPIGQHSITIEKTGHIMNVGRFPATGTYDFQNDLAAVNFQDTTLIKVVGRVVGGLKQASYIPGFGKSKNNIGKAQIILTSQQGNGCFVDTVYTNSTTGEYTVYAPPLRYLPTVKILNNPTVDFGVLNLVDLINATGVTTLYDSVGTGIIADSIKFNVKLDYIQELEPTLVVKDIDEVNDFIGDTTYTYIHINGDTIKRNLRHNPLPWPVFSNIGSDKKYSCLITAFETYVNYDSSPSVSDTVPATAGTLIFNNELASFANATVDLSKVNTLDSLKYLLYTFELASPNFNVNSSIPEYSFTRKFQLNLTLPNGTSIPWQPDVFNDSLPNGSGSPSFHAVYDKIYRGYVLGTKTDGQQFFSEGPQVPDYILRDPPGSGSYASREVGSTKTTEKQWSYNLGRSTRSDDHLFVGSNFVAGTPVMGIVNNIQDDTNFGARSSTSGGRGGRQKTTVETLQTWSTDASPTNPGRNSDVYIGKSLNFTYGISETLRLVPDSMCTEVDCIGTPLSGAGSNSLSMATTNGVYILPGGYNTNFLYSEDHIKNQLIPDLIDLRNTFLQSNSKYTSNLANNNPYYGLNNDDPRVNGDTAIINPKDIIEYNLGIRDSISLQIIFIGSTPSPEQHFYSSQAQKDKWALFTKYDGSDSLSLTGNSYTYNAVSLQDSLTGDSVRWINNQIRHWEEAIMLNEWEKVNISNQYLRDRIKGTELTKLFKKYETSLNTFTSLVAAGYVATGVSLLLNILPSPASQIQFGVKSAINIAKAEAAIAVSEYSAERQLLKEGYSQTSTNYSISSGITYSSSTSHNILKSVQHTISSSSASTFVEDMRNKINNIGIGTNKGKKFSFESKTTSINDTSSTEVVNFTLNDPDQGDFFSVDMYPSLLGWGPVFKLRPGGKTSCPYEDRVLTEYYLQEGAANTGPYAPNFVLSDRTQQRDRPEIDAAPFLLTNVPVTDPAVFNVTITNNSESNDTRTYNLGLVSTSNPFGAIVRIDGANVFADVTLGPNTSVNKVLSVEKGPGPTYDYDSLLIIVYSACDPDIRDSTYVSAHFLPACTDVNFSKPDDQWVLNNFLNDTMPVAIIDYNINFFDFNSIRLDYKPSSSPTWTPLETFYRDTTNLNDSTAQLIPTSVPFTEWDWETDQVVDGDYDLRLVSQCNLVEKISPTHSGLMDRINPHPFGTPSPADGILDPSEDILIRFNEPIDLGSLTSSNFDVRGVINGSETTHSSNLYFDGINDYVEVTGGAPLQQRDFTIEFSVKRGTLGAEAIITQGPDGNEQIFIGFDSGNHLQCKVNGQSVYSLYTYADNDWHYFAVSYNYANESVEIFEASGTSNAIIVNPGSTSMFAKYAGADKMLIGKDAASGSHFTGNLDDVRIWNTARTLSEFSLTKSIRLGSNEPGLLYNWRFDEAEGIFAKDHVRSRDGIIYGAEWTVEPGGSAIALDGVDDYIRIEKGDVNITQGMDFTLEFWFNSTQTGAASMVSTGKGDGIGADSLFAWNIAKDANGLIHVYHNGEDFVATNSNTFDGEWHHLALVLNRQGNLTSYLDGNLEASVQSTPYKDLGGPAFYLGARGYYTGSLQITDNYFEGSIDEFRFWDASRKFEQIARDKNNRMQGDEYALRIYMPFEDYQLDPTGIAILTPGLNEQIDNVNHTVTNPNGALLSSITPKIKLQRPVESIAFTYSVNNDEIIITPTTNQDLIENVTLDVTVKNVKDLNGNVMESPKTWIAYMDKNQVIWQDDLLVFSKDFGDNLSFSSSISNEGGAAKNFTIENLPDWLTIAPTSGIIQPNSQLTVSFEVNPNVNIGDYSQDIHLLTDFGFPEKLTIDLKVREDEPNWTVNPADYDYSMNIIGYLAIKDVISTSEEDMLAAFVNDECRGIAHLQYMPILDRYLVFLDVYSNVTNGEDVSFKIWDASSGIQYTEVDPAFIPFVENNVIGTVNAPQLFETDYEIAVDVPLVAGWNWIGHFLFNPDSTNLDMTMASLEATMGDEIKTLTHGFSSYTDTIIGGVPVTGWLGDVNGQGIRPELGYKLKVSKTDTLVLKGDILDPTSRTIALTEGWNWIGFISIRNQNITQALGNHNPTDGDLIKGRSQFAVYNTQLGWVGSLQVMTPGSGYMYKSADTVDFVYPFAGMFKSGANLDENIYTNETWEVDNGNFASNMTAITKINSDCEYLNDKQDLTLGVFDYTGVARSVSAIEMYGESGLSYATIAGDVNEKLDLRILDNSTLETYVIDQDLAYSSNGHLGSLSNPIELNISEEVCFKMQADAGMLSEYFKVYPTLIGEMQYLDFISNVEDGVSTGSLYNIWGQKVWESNLDLEQGFNRIELDLNDLELAPGIYHFVLESNGTQQSVKLISK